MVGLLLGLPTGAAAGVFVALLMTDERLQQLRRRLARWILRREPHVEFEALQQ